MANQGKKKSTRSRLHQATITVKPYAVIKDKMRKPIFVLVPFDIWQEASEIRKKQANKKKTVQRSAVNKRKPANSRVNWASFSGILPLREDALEYQRRVRGEWS